MTVPMLFQLLSSTIFVTFYLLWTECFLVGSSHVVLVTFFTKSCEKMWYLSTWINFLIIAVQTIEQEILHSAVILLLLFLRAWAEQCLKQIWQGTQRRCLAGAGWSVVVTDTKIRARLTQSVFSMHWCLSDIHEQWNQRCFSQLLTEKDDSGTIRIHLDPIQHYLQFHALTKSFFFFPTHCSRFQVEC